MRNSDNEYFTIEVLAHKQKKKKLTWLLAVAVLLLLAWVSVQLMQILMPRMKTAIVTQGEMNDYISVRGVVAMESVPVVLNDYQGELHYSVQPGLRVSKGVPVAEFYQNNEALQARLGLNAVQEEINHLVAAEKIYYEGGDIDVFLQQRQESLANWVTAVESDDYSKLTIHQNSIALASNKIQIITEAEISFTERLELLYERQAALQTLAVPQGYLLAPDNGYFVPALNKDKLIYNRESLKSLSEVEMQEVFGKRGLL